MASMRRLITGYVVILLTTTSALAQSSWYVDDNAANDPGPGDPLVSDPLEDGSAGHPFDAISEGVSAASNGDSVIVLDGEYAGPGNQNVGLQGKAITLRSENGAAGCRMAGSSPAFNVGNGETTATVIRGFTISPSSSGTYGGGMRCIGSSPTIIECVFSQCRSTVQGAGILCEYGADALIIDCEFRDNEMDGVSGEEKGGAGMCVAASNPTVIDCLFIGNTLSCTNAESYQGGGGGVYVVSGSPAFIGCRFIANRSTNTITSIDGYGGGVHSRGQSTFVNCSFVGNESDIGGAILDLDLGSLLINCSVAGNDGSMGSGLFSAVPTEIRNSVFWGNSGPAPVFGFNSWASITYSCLEGVAGALVPGEGCIDGDPQFARPPDPGGDGTWGTEDDDYGDLRLVAGSPCIDAADATVLPVDGHDLDGDGDVDEAIPVDLDGNARFVDDPGTTDTGVGQPPFVDMGAYEYQGGTSCPGDLTGDGMIDGADLGLLLGNWSQDGAGDLNEDGMVDGADLGLLLGAWGPCA